MKLNLKSLIFIFIISFITLFTSQAYSTPVYVAKDSRLYHHDRNCSNLTTTTDLIEFASSQQADNNGALPCIHCESSTVKKRQPLPNHPADTNSDKSKLILGCWKGEEGVIEYFKDGTFMFLTDRGEYKKKAGKWNINGNILTIKFYIHPKPDTYKILELSASTYKIVGISGKKNTYIAKRITSKQQSAHIAKKTTATQHSTDYSSVIFSFLNCNDGVNRSRIIKVRGDVPLYIDLGDDTIVKQILNDAKLFADRKANEKCPLTEKYNYKNISIYISLYQLDKKFPQLKDDSVIFAVHSDKEAYHYSQRDRKRSWSIKNDSDIVAEKKFNISKKEKEEEEEAKRLQEFESKNGIKNWVRMDKLFRNPFVYEGKIIGVLVYFAKMVTATNGIFIPGGGDMIQHIVVSNIPKGLFTTSDARIIIAGKVLGNTESIVPILGSMEVPHLEFIDYMLVEN